MKLELLDQNSNQDLLEFFKEFPIKGLVEFKVDRLQDYFGLYKLQSENHRTYALRNDQNKIQAMASFALREVFQDGEVQQIALATDLRVAPSRQAILEWSNHFLPVMKSVKEDLGVSHFFSNINLTEPSGLNLFVRPRNMRRALPRYYLYRKFSLVSLHGRFPWAPKPLTFVKIRHGNEQNIDALIAYIIKRSQFRPFASVWDTSSLRKKMARLPGFSLENFLIAFDANENVVGCLAPWSFQGIQDWIPRSYRLRAHNFRQFLKFGSAFGWTKVLPKPIRSTGFEAPLKFQYLTNIHVDNEDIFESLLHTAFSQAGPQEFLCYAQVDKDIRLTPPASWIAARIPHALYAVIPPQTDLPTFLHPSISLNPEIEAYMI